MDPDHRERPEALPYPDLWWAIRTDSLAEAAAWLAEGNDPNRYPRLPAPPVIMAARAGSAEKLELLLLHDADPNAIIPRRSGRHGDWTDLTVADAAERDDLVALLLRHGADPSTQHLHGYRPRHRAVQRGDAPGVAALLDDPSVEVDGLDAAGMSALSHAIDERHEAIARQLIDAGADVDLTDEFGSLLATAAYTDSTRDRSTGFVAMLLAAGANPDPDGYPPAFMAVDQEGTSASVLRTLVEAGTPISKRDADGATVLHRIAEIADAELVDVAVELGADLEALDDRGRTPLVVAYDNPETTARLLALGANPDARDDQGLTANDHRIARQVNEERLRRRFEDRG